MSEKLYPTHFICLTKDIFLKFDILSCQENTTGWLSETIPRDLDEKTFIQVRWFCWSLRLNSIQLNPTKNSPE